MPILAKTVFLDTQVFDQEVYDAKSSRKLMRLLELVTDGHAQVVMTDITYREIIANIRGMAKVALQHIKRSHKPRETGILRQLAPTFDVVFAKHKADEIADKLDEQFEYY